MLPSPRGLSLLLITSFTLKLVPLNALQKYMRKASSHNVIFGISNYFDGKKYCRRCEVYIHHDGLFCPCCGMQLRLTPTSRECKEILRKRRTSHIPH